MELSENLLKLPPSLTEETLALVLEALWRTRRTGLSPPEKSDLRSALALSSDQDLDPVLACLRLLIRKCANEELAGDNVQKFLPHDLPIEIQGILQTLLSKYQNQWKEEASSDQPLWQRTRVSHQVRTNGPPAPPCTGSELSTRWPRQSDVKSNPEGSNNSCTLSYIIPSLPCVVPSGQHQSKGAVNSTEIIPRFRSMTWTMQNKNSAPSSRAVVITLKLHNYTKSPSEEIEVKFQLSKDTLEAMLRSLMHINEQLSKTAAQAQPEPSSKKRKQ